MRRRLALRRQHAVFFILPVALAIALALGLGTRRRARPHTGSVLSAVPPGAWLVVTADLASLRESPIARPILAWGASEATSGLLTVCGFDPAARVTDVAIASPEVGDRGEFGVAFRADLTKNELVGCATKVIGARGGHALTTVRRGFDVIEDAVDPMHARLAYRDGGPFLIGRGPWLDAMIDATQAYGQGAGGGEHDALRESLAPTADRPGAGSHTVTMTAILPSAVRERLREELAPELGRSDATTAGLLAVRAAGVAITTGAPGSTTRLSVRLRCETAASCADVKRIVERERVALADEAAGHAVVWGGALGSLTIQVSGDALAATAFAPTDDLARALEGATEAPPGRP